MSTETHIARVLTTTSPVMRRALLRIADGDYQVHGREVSSLRSRDLITGDLTLTALGEDVITHLEERQHP